MYPVLLHSKLNFSNIETFLSTVIMLYIYKDFNL
jgi:hypothetical protein